MLTPHVKVVEIIEHLANGNGIRQTAKLCHVHRDTVQHWALAVGEGCARLLDRYLRDLPAGQIEIDEIWTFVHTKERHLKPDAPVEHGDAYLYIAQDLRSRAIISTVLGKRNFENTRRFVEDLRSRIVGRPHITSDAFPLYAKALDWAFDGELDYAQVEKSYEGACLPNGRRVADVYVRSKRRKKIGAPDLRSSSTSHVERLNGTLREGLARFIRSSRHHSKKIRNLDSACQLFIADYNFCHFHSTLRKTPFQALGLIDRAWSTSELVDAALGEPKPDRLPCHVPPLLRASNVQLSTGDPIRQRNRAAPLATASAQRKRKLLSTPQPSLAFAFTTPSSSAASPPPMSAQLSLPIGSP
jgi:IS1 family transposase